MTPRQRRRRLIVNLTEIGREGRRYYVFYKGYQARQRSQPGNPYKPGTADHACWEAGWKYACDEEEQSKSAPPVCRLGPGGDYVRDWPAAAPVGEEER